MSYDPSFVLSDEPMPSDIKQWNFFMENLSANLGNNTYVWTYEDLNFRNSIIDAGGNDLIDLSSHTNGVFVNLNPDTWSSLSYNGNVSQFSNEDNWVYEFGQFYISENSIIEDVNTSEYSDLIYDNNSINIINTGVNDTIYHSGNSDIINGGYGSDRVILNKSFLIFN